MRIETSLLQLEFCDSSGALNFWRFTGCELLSRGSFTAFELKFGEKTLCGDLQNQWSQNTENGVRVTQEYSLCAQNAYRVTQTWNIEDSGRIERTLLLQRTGGDARELLQNAVLKIAGLVAESVLQTKVTVPMARGLSARPLEELLNRPRELSKGKNPEGEHFGLQSAPDIFPGAVCLENDDVPLHVSLVPLPNQCPAHTTLWGDGERLHIEQRFGCEMFPDASTQYELARQIFLLQNQKRDAALPEIGKFLAQRGYALPHNRPEWAQNATILEAEIGFMGGLQKIREQLPELQSLGFNTIYLMPWHTGTYATRDYLQVNPEYGTLQDLRALCDAAHQRGMKVLFDMLVNIAGEGSEYPEKHPDWFYHGEDGKPLAHPTWGGTCLDPASPGFRQFLTDYAVRCCTELGADGFRVDAVAHRGGNLQPLPGLQPHQHSYAVFTLMSEINHAIKKVKPDAVLLAECFGPAQVPVSDLVCTSWISWLDWALERVLDGRLDGAHVARLLQEQFAAMPPGTWFTGYTHTHDTVAFESRDLQGPAVDALFAVMSLLCTGTMVFSGGWKMRPRPEENEKEAYRRLFQMRDKLGGVAGSDVTFEFVDNTALLLAQRPSKNGDVFLVANFSPTSQPLPFVKPCEYSYRGENVTNEIAPFDVVVCSA